MAGEWDTRPLLDVADVVLDVADVVFGYPFASKLFADHPPGLPVIRIRDLPNPGNCVYTREDSYPSSVLVEHGDLLVGMDGEFRPYRWTGSTALLNQRVCKIVPRSADSLDREFIRCAIQQPLLALEQAKTGTTVIHLNKADLEQLEIPWPPKHTRHAIAHILGTLGDKIELNRRMNETLEGMARAIFKSWFVDFDPVHAKIEGCWKVGQSLRGLPAHLYGLFPDRLVDSELGEIPEGWRMGTVEEICSRIENGGTPKRMESTYWGGQIPWFKTGELADAPLIDSAEHITDAGLANSAAKLWPRGTVLIALYASPTVGRLGILEVPATANQACSALVANRDYGNLFLFYSLLQTRERLQQIAVGAAQQNISQQVVRNHCLVIPPPPVASAFQRIVEDTYQRHVANLREFRTLAALRDTLLPKLISGELRVKDAKRIIDGAVS